MCSTGSDVTGTVAVTNTTSASQLSATTTGKVSHDSDTHRRRDCVTQCLSVAVSHTRPDRVPDSRQVTELLRKTGLFSCPVPILQ